MHKQVLRKSCLNNIVSLADPILLCKSLTQYLAKFHNYSIKAIPINVCQVVTLLSHEFFTYFGLVQFYNVHVCCTTTNNYTTKPAQFSLRHIPYGVLNQTMLKHR